MANEILDKTTGKCSGSSFRWRDRARSFVYAWRGIRTLVREEHNARIHLGVTVCVIAAGLLFGISLSEWAVIGVCIGMVLGFEALNSAVEALADHVSPGFAPLIGKAKDLAAGAVLLATFGAVAAGLAIFLPKIWPAVMSIADNARI